MRRWVSPTAAWHWAGAFCGQPQSALSADYGNDRAAFSVRTDLGCSADGGVVASLDRVDAEQAFSTPALGHIAVLAAAVYTRYDGWILAFLAWLAMAVCLLSAEAIAAAGVHPCVCSFAARSSGMDGLQRRCLWRLAGLHARSLFGRAIELRTSSSAVDPHPGWHNPWVSLVYFTKAAEMDIAALGWGEFDLSRSSIAEQPGRGFDFGKKSFVDAERGGSRETERIGLGVDASPVDAAAVLRIFRQLRFGADFFASLAALLVVQHALWHGDAAGIRIFLCVCSRGWRDLDPIAQIQIPTHRVGCRNRSADGKCC